MPLNHCDASYWKNLPRRVSAIFRFCLHAFSSKECREQRLGITCTARSNSAALPRISCSGHDRDSRSRYRSVSLFSRAEPGRSSLKHNRTPWLSSSRAAARSSSSLLHSRAKLLTVGLTSDSDSDW